MVSFELYSYHEYCNMLFFVILKTKQSKSSVLTPHSICISISIPKYEAYSFPNHTSKNILLTKSQSENDVLMIMMIKTKSLFHIYVTANK